MSTDTNLLKGYIVVRTSLGEAVIGMTDEFDPIAIAEILTDLKKLNSVSFNTSPDVRVTFNPDHIVSITFVKEEVTP